MIQTTVQTAAEIIAKILYEVKKAAAASLGVLFPFRIRMAAIDPAQKNSSVNKCFPRDFPK